MRLSREIFCRFVVLQALMLWQGGFLFYAVFVVPTGTEVLGSFQQGRVTREVTLSMNLIGVATLLFLAWDQFQTAGKRRARWIVWTVLVTTLAAQFICHFQVERFVDFTREGRIEDYPAFYFWHRVYLCVAAVQWTAGLACVLLTLMAWRTPASTTR